MRAGTFLPPVLGAALLLGACRLGDVTGNVARNAVGGRGAAGDVIAAAVTGITDTYEQMNVKFSPEQEYYLGRGVAAHAIATYGLDPDEGTQAYVRKIGAALVEAAPRIRSTYGGYHFAVLNSPTPNGMSGPGGYVLITRGALDLARSEDEVAAVLAHEIAHVSLQHGEAVIRAGNTWKSQFGALGRVVGAAGGGGKFESTMATIFADVTTGFARQLSDQGYGSELEFKADLEGTYILYEAGYDATSIQKYLQALPDRPTTAWQAHPESAARSQRLAAAAAQWGGPFDGGSGAAARLARFRRSLPGK